MCRKFYLIILCSVLLTQLNAAHLKGGWIQYEYLGDGAAANSSKYRITVRQYLDCGSEFNAGQRDQEVYIGIFNSTTNLLFTNITVPRTNFEKLDKNQSDPCFRFKFKALAA